MKIKVYITLLFFVCGITAMAIIIRVNRPLEKDRAIMEAVKKQDTPQLIKSLITRMSEQMEKDSESFPELIKEVDNYAKQCKDSTAVAVFHSMEAEMYSTYYESHRGDIDQRTDLQNFVPEDIREWTANLFTAKIEYELAASLQPASLLQQTSVNKFDLIMDKGGDMLTLRPTLYDFLAHRAIDIQPADRWYAALMDFRRTQSNKKALLMDDLDYLSFLYDGKDGDQTKYKNALDSLSRLYGKESFGAEIKIAELKLLEDGYYGEMANQSGQFSELDSIRDRIYSFCKFAIAQYPMYKRINVLKNKVASMERPVLNIKKSNQNVYPGKELSIDLSYNNIHRVSVCVYKSLGRPEAMGRWNSNQTHKYGELVKEVGFNLKVQNTYTSSDTTLRIPMSQLGLYEYVIAAEDADVSSKSYFSVSRLAALTRIEDKRHSVLVTDIESGKPINDASVVYYRRNSRNGSPEKSGEVKTDTYGLAVLPENCKVDLIQPLIKDDSMSIATQVYYYQSREVEQNMKQVSLSLFTDRNIYRPNQTIFFKGIAFVKDTEGPHVVANHKFVVTFRDANGKEIASKEFTTNKMGSFNGEFVIPPHTLNGQFTLVSEHAYAAIKVEAYRRPSFKVDIAPLKEEVRFGKSVSITGKAQLYSGVALQTGTVKWQINRRPFWFLLYRLQYTFGKNSQVANGTASLNQDGSFSFNFVPEKEQDMQNRPAYQSYEVKVSMTDSKGETQEAEYEFSIGETGFLLHVDTKHNEMERDSAFIKVQAYTVNQKKVQTQGTFAIYVLSDRPLKKDRFGKEEYQVGEKKSSGRFTTQEAIGPKIFQNLSSGRYRMEVKATDSFGQVVSDHEDFILYDRSDKKPPVFMHTWVLKDRIECSPGENAEFVFGTSDKQAYVLYEVFTATGKCTQRKTIVLNNENRLFSIPFTANDGDGFTVSLTFVKEGKMYNKKIEVMRKLPDRRLVIKTETFRDQLLPGNKENWKFRITDADAKVVSAEVLASMYDASLDNFGNFKWIFFPVQSVYLQSPLFETGSAFSSSNDYAVAKIQELTVSQYKYDHLNWQNALSVGYGGRRLYAMNALAAPGVNMMAQTKAAVDVENMDNMNVEESSNTIFYSKERSQAEVKLRSDFAETAFFYPVLATDEHGDVAFSFNAPESNTTWKLQLLAQTEDLKYGYLSKDVIASKPLMIVPNLPRFLREGDRVSISTQIINRMSNVVNGKVRLELFDPESDQTISELMQPAQSFNLKADSATMVIWTFDVPVVSNELVGCRIVAESDRGSDGEQHLIPVLSNKIMITESTPFFLSDKDQLQLALQKKGTPYRVTLEMTSNPIWYAVQALPTISRPDNDNIITWFNAYYSNTLASYIASANPRIKQVISQWKAKGGTASTLYSNLQKNEELKTILLQETPWVLEAENETEQKQRLELLFDMNRSMQMRNEAMQQLLQQQLPDGGWGWFKGMYSSRDITCYILLAMNQLTQLGAIEYSQEEKEMQMKALSFLDNAIQNDYENLKKHNPSWKKTIVNADQLNYLFMRSSYRNIPEPALSREAIRFYTSSAQNNWNKLSLYGRAETALLMHRNGIQKTTHDIMAWLRKTATTSSEKGMYWANNRYESFSLFSPINTHCLLMEAFHEISPVKQEIDQMKQWLLVQKRTQNWETAPATVNAIYALLLTGSDWLKVNNECVAQWGNKTYSSEDGETSTGYLKISAQKEALISASDKIVISKKQSTPIWGAVYEQYFTNLDQVEKSRGVLNVEKKLFIETNNGSERQLQAVTYGQPLKVGDKIVIRLTIRTDREMNYVFLKDLHAGFFEANNQISKTVYRDKVWYYESPTDISENIFFDRLPQGTYVLEYSGYVARSGQFSSGISTIQCLYAPEYVSHTEGEKLIVKQ